jgi:NADH-quinone oxidoreductase subunit M
LPGLNGFVGEFMVLLAAFQRAWAGSPVVWRMTLSVLAAGGVVGAVLGAWYMLWLYQRLFFGPLRTPGRESADRSSNQPLRDLNWREVFALAPLAVFVVWIGLYPKFFLDRMAPTLDRVAVTVEQRFERQGLLANRPTPAPTESVARVR